MSSEPKRKKARTARGSRGVAARGKREAENAMAEAHSPASSGVVAEVGDDVDWVELTDDAKKLLRYRGNRQLYKVDQLLNRYWYSPRDPVKVLRVLYENGLHGKCMAPRGSSLLRFLDISDLVGEVSSFLICEESKSKIQRAELVARGLQRTWTAGFGPSRCSRVWWAAYGNDVGTLRRLISIREKAGKRIGKVYVLRAGVKGDALDALRYLYERWGAPSKEVHLDLVFTSVKYERAQTLEFLLQSGADVNDRDPFGDTALMYACEFGKVQSVAKLLEHGADVEIENLGMTALKLACSRGWYRLFSNYQDDKQVRKQKADWSSRFRQSGAIEKKDDVVRMLLDHGADVNGGSSGRKSALFVALESSRWDAAATLIKVGAEVNSPNGSESPLGLACMKLSLPTVRLLIEHGADVNHADSQGCSLLSRLITANQSPSGPESVVFHIARTLLQHGAAVDFALGQGTNTVFASINTNLPSTYLELLLEHGADVNCRNRAGKTPLLIAARQRLIHSRSNRYDEVKSRGDAFVRILLENGADVNVTNAAGVGPVALALDAKCLGRAVSMIEHGADANVRDSGGQTPLILALREGDPELVQKVLDGGADVNLPDGAGTTPLFLACGFTLGEYCFQASGDQPSPKQQQRMVCLQKLLERGADPNITNSSQQSPLSFVCSAPKHVYSFEFAQLLLDHGADVHVVGESKRTPLHLAAMNRKGKLVRLLLERGANPNAKAARNEYPLTLAAEAGSNVSVCALLEHGADANVKVKKSVGSVQHLAARSGLETGMRGLLERGIAVDTTNTAGDTPLMDAVRRNRVSTARILIEHGANVNARNTQGSSPLAMIFMAKQSRCRRENQRDTPACMRLLLESGAEVDATDVDGCTPLILAIRAAGRDLNRIQSLIHAGANVNAACKTGWTPLFWACSKGDKKCVRELYQNGADPLAVDSEGRSVLDVTNSKCRADLVRMRREARRLRKEEANRREKEEQEKEAEKEE